MGSSQRNPQGRLKKTLPRRFDDTRNQALKRHLAEAKTRQLEFAKKPPRSSCKLATISEPNRRRIFWQFVQSIDGSEPLFDIFAHIENRLFQRLALFPFIFYHSLSFLLSCDLRFFCHFSSISCAQALFGAACG